VLCRLGLRYTGSAGLYNGGYPVCSSIAASGRFDTRAFQKHLVDSNSHHRLLCGIRGHKTRRKIGRMFHQEARRRPHGSKHGFSLGSLCHKAPAFRLLGYGGPVGLGLETRCREDAAIIAAASDGPHRVNRALSRFEHGAPPLLVIAHEHMALGQARGGEEQFTRNMRESLLFVGANVDEIRRRAAAHAIAAGNRHTLSGFLPSLGGAKPFREVFGFIQILRHLNFQVRPRTFTSLSLFEFCASVKAKTRLLLGRYIP
jgi:hypothetical protein